VKDEEMQTCLVEVLITTHFPEELWLSASILLPSSSTSSASKELRTFNAALIHFSQFKKNYFNNVAN
jgi:hypothetical protein